MARLWRESGFTVTEAVGGHGVVAVLRNGAAPTVMLRTDLDGLPVTEQTGLPYASRVRTIDSRGAETGVMHACGHDVHMTTLVGTARLLASHREMWRGTLMLVGQPAEETVEGAKVMLADGLFDRFPKPDVALAEHCDSSMAAGHVGIRVGYVMANSDTVDIVVRGRGGHGAMPHTTIDPIVQAAELVLALQTLVSREVPPTEPAVVTTAGLATGRKPVAPVLRVGGPRGHSIGAFSEEFQKIVVTRAADVATQWMKGRSGGGCGLLKFETLSRKVGCPWIPRSSVGS